MTVRSAQQLPLHLSLRHDATFATYVAANNEQLHRLLSDWGALTQEHFVYLWGGAGCGKSHLIQATCHATQALGLTAVYLPLRQHDELSPEVLQGLEQLQLVCLDDLDAVAGQGDWEEGLFGLYNSVKDRGGVLLAGGDAPPAEIALSLSDLKSRLNWGQVFQVNCLPEAHRLAALCERARFRGIELPIEVGQYILRHCPRDMPSVMAVLDKIDNASLAQRRRITIPFVKAVLR